MQLQTNRLPNSDESSDWHCAWNYALNEKPPEVKHLAACLFGENDGPDWVWIFQLKDDSWAFLKAGCDYTGWDCQSGGEWKGGFKTPEEAIQGIPPNWDITDKMRADLLAQVNHEQPYALGAKEE